MHDIIKLFRFDCYRLDPHAHDAVCHEIERRLRDGGSFDHFGPLERQEKIAAAVRDAYSWSSERCGTVQTEFNGGRFFADVYLGPTDPSAVGAPVYQESFDLGSVSDDPTALRVAFLALPERLAKMLDRSVYFDSEEYEILVERFDFQRFCSDHQIPAPELVAARSRTWN